MKGMLQVSTGDMIRPDPSWNRTDQRDMHLPDPVAVLGVKLAQSQSGFVLKVVTASGKMIWLEPGWFTENLTSGVY